MEYLSESSTRKSATTQESLQGFLSSAGQESLILETMLLSLKYSASGSVFLSFTRKYLTKREIYPEFLLSSKIGLLLISACKLKVLVEFTAKSPLPHSLGLKMCMQVAPCCSPGRWDSEWKDVVRGRNTTKRLCRVWHPVHQSESQASQD